jgi:hypothetical protein
MNIIIANVIMLIGSGFIMFSSLNSKIITNPSNIEYIKLTEYIHNDDNNIYNDNHENDTTIYNDNNIYNDDSNENDNHEHSDKIKLLNI